MEFLILDYECHCLYDARVDQKYTWLGLGFSFCSKYKYTMAEKTTKKPNTALDFFLGLLHLNRMKRDLKFNLIRLYYVFYVVFIFEVKNLNLLN